MDKQNDSDEKNVLSAEELVEMAHLHRPAREADVENKQQDHHKSSSSSTTASTIGTSKTTEKGGNDAAIPPDLTRGQRYVQRGAVFAGGDNEDNRTLASRASSRQQQHPIEAILVRGHDSDYEDDDDDLDIYTAQPLSAFFKLDRPWTAQTWAGWALSALFLVATIVGLAIVLVVVIRERKKKRGPPGSGPGNNSDSAEIALQQSVLFSHHAVVLGSAFLECATPGATPNPRVEFVVRCESPGAILQVDTLSGPIQLLNVLEDDEQLISLPINEVASMTFSCREKSDSVKKASIRLHNQYSLQCTSGATDAGVFTSIWSGCDEPNVTECVYGEETPSDDVCLQRLDLYGGQCETEGIPCVPAFRSEDWTDCSGVMPQVRDDAYLMLDEITEDRLEYVQTYLLGG